MISRLSQLIENTTRESPLVIIEGVTGAGKTELLRHIYTEHKKREGALYYFSVQEEQWAEKWRKPTRFVDEVFQPHMSHVHLFIDDVHLIPSPLQFLNQIRAEFEKRGCNIHVTATTGLHLQPLTTDQDRVTAPVFFRVYGASVRDLVPQGIKDTSVTYDSLITLDHASDLRSLYQTLQSPRITKRIQDVVRYGGLHIDESRMDKSNETRIQELTYVRNKHFQSVIGPTCSLQRSFKCFAIAEYISQQTGRFLKESDIESAVNYPVHRIKKGLEILAQSFLFQYSTPFFTDTRYETAKRPIVYATDPGIVVSYAPSRTAKRLDQEQEVLTFLYSEFLKQYLYDDIQYYRTIVGKQIPFILKKGKVCVAVGLSLGSDHSAQLSVLKSFKKKYTNAVTHTILITADELDLSGDIPRIPFILAPFVAFIQVGEQER